MIMVLALSLQFDGEAGETFSNACAIFCRNQSHGLEVLRSKIRKDQKAACFLQVSVWETVAGPERVGFQSLDTRHCTTCLTKSRTFFRILISLQKKDILFYVFRSLSNSCVQMFSICIAIFVLCGKLITSYHCWWFVATATLNLIFATPDGTRTRKALDRLSSVPHLNISILLKYWSLVPER